MGNNNPDCSYDAGDCCPVDPPPTGWDQFCTECECKAVGGCGVPGFVGDGYCDDSNNNAECGYDSGDCCEPHVDGWDSFCLNCECLEGQNQCEDEGSAKFCKKNKKKCKKAKIAKKCKKTCDKCDEGPEPCEDTGSKKQCKKVNAKKCKKAKIAKKCKKSCNLC